MAFFDAGTINRLINQYQASPAVKNLLMALIDEPNSELKFALESLYGRLNIDGSSGIQLDRIGEIVGQPRPDSASELFEPEDPDNTFTFTGIGEINDPNKGFSGIGREGVGGKFAGATAIDKMPDYLYRVLLRAAIYRNNRGATIGDIELYSEIVLGVAANVINGVGYMDIQFQRPLSSQERAIIKGTLKPAAGIRIRFLSFSLGANPFGFAGGTNTGFGGIGVEQEGSGFVRLF